MAEGRLYDVARAQRALLLSNERQAASEMVRVYGAIWFRIKQRLDDLLAERDELIAAGEVVDTSWLWQQDRLNKLLYQVQSELWRFSQYADATIVQQQGLAVEAALRDAHQQVLAIAGQTGVSLNWSYLPTVAIEDLIGFTANGSPLRELLDRLGPLASEAVRSALIEGIAQGYNPEKIGRSVREAFGGNLSRALQVSRTEVLRSYREATRRSYEVNDDVVEGWIWNAACTSRTCAMCWAMHGTVHPVTERLDDHPSGRCSMLPKVKGLPGMAPQWLPEAGVDQFARLSPDEQRHILGPLYDAYHSGEITLPDVVGRSFSPDWGSMRRVKSLKELFG